MQGCDMVLSPTAAFIPPRPLIKRSIGPRAVQPANYKQPAAIHRYVLHPNAQHSLARRPTQQHQCTSGDHTALSIPSSTYVTMLYLRRSLCLLFPRMLSAPGTHSTTDVSRQGARPWTPKTYLHSMSTHTSRLCVHSPPANAYHYTRRECMECSQ